MLSERLTQVAGVSDVFWGGVVSYSNTAKERLLGIADELIRDYGAVSGPVARAMALGVSQHSGAKLSVSVSGIAGPGGGTREKPVGTVWFGVASRFDSELRTGSFGFRFSGDREAIRSGATLVACRLAAGWLESARDLDSLRLVANNVNQATVFAIETPVFLPLPSNTYPTNSE